MWTIGFRVPALAARWVHRLRCGCSTRVDDGRHQSMVCIGQEITRRNCEADEERVVREIARRSHREAGCCRRPSQARALLRGQDLATLFNVRRESVAEAAASLRSRDLIRYSRGTITILNRKGLLSASCACYRRIEALHAA